LNCIIIIDIPIIIVIEIHVAVSGVCLDNEEALDYCVVGGEEEKEERRSSYFVSNVN
jgi:hypothetical protein